MDEDSVGGVPWFTATATAAANRSGGWAVTVTPKDITN